MKLIAILKYRWKYDYSPPSGELWPTENGTRVIAYTLPEERETCVPLRKLRAVVLGYGPAWTFAEALKDTFLGWL